MTVINEVVRELFSAARAAVKSAKVRDLARKAGVEPDDIAQTVLLREVERVHLSGGDLTSGCLAGGNLVRLSGSHLKRTTARAAANAAIDEYRRAHPREMDADGNETGARTRREVFGLDVTWVDPTPDPEQRLWIKQAMAGVRDRSVLARALSGSTYTQQAHRAGVHPSTMSRRAKQERKRITFEQVQMRLPFNVQ